MNPPGHTVRRANLDDLEGLKKLWERARLQVLDLEKRLTEFQLIVSDTGDLVGAIGLHLEAKHGKLHGEAFTAPEQQDTFRPMLWERVQTLARNHGLVRLWTQEGAPFWTQNGFTEVSPELLKKLPASFGDSHARWLSLQLKEESAPALSLEKEFEMFQQAQRASTEQVMEQARKFKTLAYVIGFAVFFGALVGGGYLIVKLNREKNRGPAIAPGQTNVSTVTNGVAPAR